MPRNPRNLSYKDDLLADLRGDKNYARTYLAAAWKDSQEALLVALRDVTEALKGSVGTLAVEAQVNRESLYRTLSSEGNPRFSTLYSVLNALDISPFEAASIPTGGSGGPRGDLGISRATVATDAGQIMATKTVPSITSAYYPSAKPKQAEQQIPINSAGSPVSLAA